MNRFALLLIAPLVTLPLLPTTRANADSPTAPSMLPVTRVTLYTSGVGYFERTGKIDGDAVVPLNFQIGQINDVLKSLVLLDYGGGSIQPVTYAAQDPVSKQLQAFSVDLSDNPDRATLFNRLRGASVTVSYVPNHASSSVMVTGVIVGVENHSIVVPGNPPSQETVSVLNVLAEDGLHSIAFDAMDTLKVNDPALDAELRKALTAVGEGRDADKRPVTLHFSGKGKREVLVAYVSETPVWQTSYRLLLGKKSTLQGWGLVQNTSQEDWNNVALTLVSGRPISFIQDMYTPLYVKRPLVRSQLGQALGPVSYEGNLDTDEVAATYMNVKDKSALGAAMPTAALTTNGRFGTQFSKYSISPAAEPADTPAQMFQQSMGATGARLGEALFTYNIPVGVSIARRQSAMIPFITSPIEAQKVGIYNSSVNAKHPLTGARVKNTSGLHLLGGPITVFDSAGATSYVGDAIIDDTQPNETRLISFALDVPIAADAKPGPGSGRYFGFRIVKGVLETISRTESSTIYTMKNNGEQDQTIVVEHPNPGSDWKLLEPVASTERTSTVLRFDVAAPAGKSTALKVRMSRINWQSLGIIDMDIDNLLVYMHDGAMPDDVRAALQEVAARRQKVSDAQSRVDNLKSQIDALTGGQQRIRDNMRVLDNSSPLYKRYAGELDAQETKLNDLMTRRDAAQSDLAKLQASLADYLANLTIGELPSVPAS